MAKASLVPENRCGICGKNPSTDEFSLNTKYHSHVLPVKAITRGPKLSGGNILEEVFPHLGEDCSGRKVMVVIDSTREAKRALQWVLSHALRNHDSLILLHVAQLAAGSKHPLISGKCQISSKESNALNSLKELCRLQRPMVEVEMMIEGGEEKGPTILDEAKKRHVSLLVLGQPNASFLSKLRVLLTGKSQKSSAAAVVEYCIQNSECMTMAVKKKSQNEGGYLISTKKHKNFWLLA